MSTDARRRYASPLRRDRAQATRARILDAARDLFTRQGIDTTPLADIAMAARVSPSTLYTAFGSRDGILRALMEDALFGPRTQAVLAALDRENDPVAMILHTPAIARAIYEGEALALGDLRRLAGHSPSLRAIEAEFDARRLAMQAPRIDALIASGRARPGLSRDQAARILWMFTARSVWQMLTLDGGWTGEAYQSWLTQTLSDALIAQPGLSLPRAPD